MFCWLFRLMISNSIDVNRPISATTKRHLEKCPNCRHFYSLCHSLEEALPAEAKVLVQDSPPISNERIMQGIAKTGNVNVDVRNKFRPFAVAAGIALILLVGILLLPSGRKTANDSDFGMAVAELTDMLNLDREQALSGLVEKPLATELQSIVADTESAARFLYTCVAVDVVPAEHIEQNN